MSVPSLDKFRGDMYLTVNCSVLSLDKFHGDMYLTVNCSILYLDKFRGDMFLIVKLLLPGVVKSVYNLNDKQLAKLFSRIFRANQDDMVRDLEQVCSLSSSFIKGRVYGWAT